MVYCFTPTLCLLALVIHACIFAFYNTVITMMMMMMMGMSGCLHAGLSLVSGQTNIRQEA